MIKKIKNLFSSDTAKGSLILIIGTFIFNILNYIFHFSMARMLGPADYGILASLMSIVYLFSIPTETIQAIIARYTAIFKARKEIGKIKSLMNRAIKKGWKFGIIGIILFAAVSPFIKNFLKFDSIIPLLALAILILPVILLPITRGILQGLKKFKALGFNMSFEGAIKLVLAISLVLIGLNVNGAIAAILISGFLAFSLSKYYVNDINKSKEKFFDKKNIYSSFIPVLIAIICLTMMYSMDVIIVKHFFSDQEAGVYSVASLLGKMIFFALIPAAKAMFPIVAERQEAKKEHRHVLSKILLGTSLIMVLILAVYYLFPEFLITILFGNRYIEAANILFYLGVAFSLMTITYMISFYYLSLGKSKIIWALIPCTILELVLISLFSSSLIQFSIAFVVSSFITCFTLFLINKKMK